VNEPRRYGDAGNAAEVVRLESQARSMSHLVAQEFQLLNLRPNLKVLDAGCGSGAITRMMAKAVYPETIVGMDIDPVFIEEARKMATSKAVENIRFELGNIDAMDYEDGAFDLTYSRFVLAHVNDPVRSVSEMKRVTKKGGYVAASDIEDDIMTGYPEVPMFWDLWKKNGMRAARLGVNRHIGRELYSIFNKAGLSSISVHPMPFYATAANPDVLKETVSVPVGVLQSVRSGMIADGLASDEDFDTMLEEINQLAKDEGAFCMGCAFLAIGKVPPT
jgi:ubiquinone/menaquinone biosynthesis C-methylase UbiE